ncbi:hypothetical protein S40288_11500 [Stachybotrys chartarum IBT 40288]|nr:hypothetical protein S40288_11500 [Stachybotrys chartarum IBT 40288]
MRGLLYTEDYFPADWFSKDKIKEDERFFEVASMTEERQEKILWLGRKIAEFGNWLAWNEANQQFKIDVKYDTDTLSLIALYKHFYARSSSSSSLPRHEVWPIHSQLWP